MESEQTVRKSRVNQRGSAVGRQTYPVYWDSVDESVYLKWKSIEANPTGDFFVRSGPGTVKLLTDSAAEYVRTRFPNHQA